MDEIFCMCGCGAKLRKDNKSGYSKGHKPCPVCGKLVSKSNTECCSKSCSAKLHWQRHPEMKNNRSWNEQRLSARSENTEWRKNLSDARLNFFKNGGKNWNESLSKEDDYRIKKQGETYSQKILEGSIVPPFQDKKHSEDWYDKVKETNLKLYGTENCGWMATSNSVSKLEQSCENFLSKYGFLSNRFLGPHQIDYINYKSKQIIEINGDYWHCNPAIYLPDYFNQKLNKTAQEIWQSEYLKHEKFRSYGYQVFVIWEHDINKYGVEYCFNKEMIDGSRKENSKISSMGSRD